MCQGAVTHLSEQISTLNDRMDDLTSCIDELNSMLTGKKVSPSLQNISLQPESCNVSAPTSYLSGLGNGSLTPNSPSSSHLAKESSLMEELMNISRGQRQVMYQLDNLKTLLCENKREKLDSEKRHRITGAAENGPAKVVAILAWLAAGGWGIILFKGYLSWRTS